jgi:hypothetical protein
MKSQFLKTITLIILILIVLIQGKSFCQDNQKHRENSQAITSEQAAMIKTILSKYKASTVTADEAKEIHEKFREAGIHAGPETRDAIIAAGFDPEKLRALAPPPSRDGKDGRNPPTIEERLKMAEEKIISPLSLDADQKAKVSAAFKDFYTDMDKLMDNKSERPAMPEKSKVEALKKVRDDKVKQAIPGELFPKYLELEKAAHPQKHFEGRERSK